MCLNSQKRVKLKNPDGLLFTPHRADITLSIEMHSNLSSKSESKDFCHQDTGGSHEQNTSLKLVSAECLVSTVGHGAVVSVRGVVPFCKVLTSTISMKTLTAKHVSCCGMLTESERVLLVTNHHNLTELDQLAVNVNHNGQRPISEEHTLVVVRSE